MKPGDPMSLLSQAEMELLLSKLAHKASADSFTPRERELMEQMREARDVILPQLRAATQMYKGANARGREKLENLIDAVEKICAYRPN